MPKKVTNQTQPMAIFCYCHGKEGDIMKIKLKIALSYIRIILLETIPAISSKEIFVTKYLVSVYSRLWTM